MLGPRVTVTCIILFGFLGCSGGNNAAAAGAGGGSVAGSSAASGGLGALGAAGSGNAGFTAGGSGAQSTAGATGGGTAGASGAGSAIPATFQTVKLVLGGGGPIMPCAAAPCHGVNGMAPPGHPLELPPNDDSKLYTNLTSYVAMDCNNMTLVTPGNPAQSALLTILSGPCGMVPRMPFGCSADAGNCIPDDYVAAVRQWITAGAPR
jgi:hypothetical protein